MLQAEDPVPPASGVTDATHCGGKGEDHPEQQGRDS